MNLMACPPSSDLVERAWAESSQVLRSIGQPFVAGSGGVGPPTAVVTEILTP